MWVSSLGLAIFVYACSVVAAVARELLRFPDSNSVQDAYDVYLLLATMRSLVQPQTFLLLWLAFALSDIQFEWKFALVVFIASVLWVALATPKDKREVETRTGTTLSDSPRVRNL